MNSVLCPIDFSETSINALEYAVRIGEKNGSALQLLYVFNEKEFDKLLGEDLKHLTYKQLLSRAENRLQALVDKINDESIPRGLIKATYHISLGKLESAIVDYTNSEKYELIVMGTDGVSDIREAFLGSNTIRVIDKANCPVMCVPNNASYADFKSIVYATDYREEDKLAIQQVVAFATVFDCRIHVLHVSHNDEIIEKAVYTEFVQELRTFIRYDKVSFEHKVVKTDISQGIEEFLNEKDGDLLVVLRKNRNFFENLVHKSITKKLSYLTDHPLLAVKLN